MEITEEVNGRVFRRCRSATKGDYLSDDIAQEVLLNVWRYVDDFLPEKLLAVMIREKYHAVRLGIKEHEDIEDHAESLPHEGDYPIFDQLREQFEHIRFKVDLSRKQRLVLDYVLLDIPYTTACEMANIDHREYYKMVSKFKEVLND